MKPIDFNILIREIADVIKEEAISHRERTDASNPLDLSFTTVRIEVAVGKNLKELAEGPEKNFKKLVLVHINT